MMTNEECFKAIITYNISVEPLPHQKWTREDGSVFFPKWRLIAKGTDFGVYETLRDGIMMVAKDLESRPKQRR
jgi:hypothetical protein